MMSELPNGVQMWISDERGFIVGECACDCVHVYIVCACVHHVYASVFDEKK